MPLKAFKQNVKAAIIRKRINIPRQSEGRHFEVPPLVHGGGRANDYLGIRFIDSG